MVFTPRLPPPWCACRASAARWACVHVGIDHSGRTRAPRVRSDLRGQRPRARIAAIRSLVDPEVAVLEQGVGQTRLCPRHPGRTFRAPGAKVLRFFTCGKLVPECAVRLARAPILGSPWVGGVHPAGEVPPEGFELPGRRARLGYRACTWRFTSRTTALVPGHRDCRGRQHVHRRCTGEVLDRRVEAACPIGVRLCATPGRLATARRSGLA